MFAKQFVSEHSVWFGALSVFILKSPVWLFWLLGLNIDFYVCSSSILKLTVLLLEEEVERNAEEFHGLVYLVFCDPVVIEFVSASIGAAAAALCHCHFSTVSLLLNLSIIKYGYFGVR